jgi:hypothetical protein
MEKPRKTSKASIKYAQAREYRNSLARLPAPAV